MKPRLAPLLLLASTLLLVAAPPLSQVNGDSEGSKFSVQFKTTPEDYHILYRGTDLRDLSRPVRMRLGSDDSVNHMRDTISMMKRAFFRVETIPLKDARDTDGDGLTDIEELRLPDSQHPLNPAQVDPAHGTAIVTSREQFETLAHRDNVPGANGIRELKFLLVGVDTDHPELYLINTKEYPFHYTFYDEGLDKPKISNGEFNRRTYFSNSKRRNLAGSVIAHDNFVNDGGSTGIYTIEFWPTDPVAFHFIEMAYEMLSASLPFIDGNLAYHPAGETQRTLFKENADAYEQSIVRTVQTEPLFGNQNFTALNPGISFGRLILVEDRVAPSLTVRDIVIFRHLPNDLTHVSGIITEVAQTPLSHVNLKAKQNGTPNAYVKEASQVPAIKDLIGKLVRYEVTPDSYALEEATAAEVDQYLENLRPKETQIPERDLSVTTIQALGEIQFRQSDSFGAKAANLSELNRILPEGMTPEGLAIPFSFYHEFMTANGLYAETQDMLSSDGFHNDPELREKSLKAFRKRLRNAPVPESLASAILTLHESFPPGTHLRCRSSTNNEDLPGFNGAGLYDSYTHYPREGKLENSIKQVWASMWNYRAFEEREFYRIQHDQAAMGVIVHPNYEDELSNGVAVTKNLIDPNWIGYYVNVQVGEELVTNPSEDAIPDEFLVSLLAVDPEIDSYEYEVQYVRKSNLRDNGEPILTESQILDLANQMERIQSHFISLYRGNPSFAMEIEFKHDENDQLVIKQARPWID